MLRRIVYSSKATAGMTLRDVYDIIRVAHNRNSQNGLTGGLLFIDGYFYQTLEGLPASVDLRMARILQDPRHGNVIFRLDQTASHPLFESEWMALRDQSQISPDMLARHHYVVGLPPEQFGGEQVLEFLLDCFARPAARLREVG